MNKMNIYYNLPSFLQNMACCYEGQRIKRTRYSKSFWAYLEEYEKRNDWTYQQMVLYRNKKLQIMIKHCFETVPYYNKLFKELNIDYKSIKTIDDLALLPILTKDDVKENIKDFISLNFKKSNLIIHSTGGTTGSGLPVYTTNEQEAEQWAVWWRYRRNLGISFNMWCGNFGGKTIVPVDVKHPPYWRYNKPGKQVFFSGYHINEKTAPYYAEELVKKNIKWIHGYPSNIANLASCLLSNNIKISLDFVTVGSENLYEYQSKLILEAFNTTPYQHYGLTEGVANISQRNDGNLYVDEDFSVVEFIKTNESTYSIIGTTLTNWVMPLLRYDTGDYTSIEIKVPSNNQFNGRKVENINGRVNEFIILNDNTRISSAALSLIFKDFMSIREAQIIQKDINKIIVRIVKSDNYDEKKVLKSLRERLGTNINISFEYVESIERTINGKLRLVISEII